MPVVIGGGDLNEGRCNTRASRIFKFGQTFEADPVVPEYGTVVDGVMHHLLVPGPEADKSAYPALPP